MKRWADVREWMNVVVAAAALIVSIVSFWTTTRISGLEDYLKSEVEQRNAELTSLNKRSSEQEAIANNRAERLSQLQGATELATATAVAQQRELTASTDRLRAVQLQSAAAASQLLTVKAETQRLGNETVKQKDDLDLLYRREAYENLSSIATFVAFGLVKDVVPDGQSIVKTVSEARPAASRLALIPYYRLVQDNWYRTCPALVSAKLNIPPEPSKPDIGQPTFTYRRGSSSAQIEALKKAALDKWQAQWSDWSLAVRRHSDAASAEHYKLGDQATDCICRSLAAGRRETAAICPKETSQPSSKVTL